MASGSPRSIRALTPIGFISPTACASAAANGRTWTETVRIVRVPCRFGGERPYFICPGVVSGIACGRRVAKLLRRGSLLPLPALLWSRLCQPARRRMDRMLRRANKIRMRLGGEPGMAALFPERPKACGSGPTSACVIVFDAEMAAEDEIRRAAGAASTTRLGRSRPKSRPWR